jgi:hypothetical protein
MGLCVWGLIGLDISSVKGRSWRNEDNFPLLNSISHDSYILPVVYYI